MWLRGAGAKRGENSNYTEIHQRYYDIHSSPKPRNTELVNILDIVKSPPSGPHGQVNGVLASPNDVWTL